MNALSSWNGLIGQAPAKTYLRAAFTSRRLAHGYLFSGPQGVGKRSAAYIFAQVALCSNRPALDEACGACKSCRWFQTRDGAVIGHPDVIGLLLQKKGGDGATLSERLVGDHEQVIRMDTILYVCEQLHRSPMAGFKRVVIVPEAQRFCRGQAEAANAFLKTLEEPPAASLIILTSSQPEGLLETIVSRVQAVQFKRLSAAEVIEGIKRRWPGFDETSLNVTGMADGSIGRAFELLDGDVKTWRARVARGLENFSAAAFLSLGTGIWLFAEQEGERLFEAEKQKAKPDDAAAGDSDDADELQAPDDKKADEEKKTSAGWKRHVFLRLLTLCEIAFRDGLVVAASNGDTSAPLLQPDLPNLANALAQKFGVDGCQKALDAIRDAQLATRLYVRGDVTARALVGRFKAALR